MSSFTSLLLWMSPVAVIVFLWALFATLLPRLRRRQSEALAQRARQTFAHRREWLEARFVTLASQSGKPRGLAWVGCDFQNEVRFARDRETGLLRAFVGVTISFEAIEGGGMEDVEAVGNLRAATAVFQFDGQDWRTDGRALFNLSPEQAIQRYQHEVETVE